MGVMSAMIMTVAVFAFKRKNLEDGRSRLFCGRMTLLIGDSTEFGAQWSFVVLLSALPRGSLRGFFCVVSSFPTRMDG